MYQITLEGSDAAFDCAATENLLDAAARAGIELPYSCRKGVCGNCRGQVLTGELQPGSGGCGPETGAANEHLLCQARPASDLLLRPKSWHKIDPLARKQLAAKVFRVTRVADDVLVLQLRFAAGVRVKFQAGQYLQVLLPDGQRRAFSMANAPHESDGVQLHIRQVPGGLFSGQILPTLQPGDVLQVELPHGDFWLREDSARPLLLVAGGTGFAPIRSIVEHLLRQKIQRPVQLFWGVRTPGGLYAGAQVQRWQTSLAQLQFHPVVSAPAEGDGWSGATGMLHEAIAAWGQPLADWDAYVCGAPPMVRAVRALCCGPLGLAPAQFFSDAFVPA